MGRRINITFGVVLLVVALMGCKDPFEMELRSTDRSLLVVDGFLNKGAASKFRLSRTISLSDKNQLKPELRATVTVEGRDNSVAVLTDRGSGFYEAMLNDLEVGKDYRLRIRTLAGKEYLSDYVAIKNNPPIDSLTWEQDDGGVRIYVSTHDPSNETRYYRWDYEETWEQRSNYVSQYKYVGDGKVVPRNMVDDDVSVCWRSAPSTTIILGSSAQLRDDVISESPVNFIDLLNEKLAHRYSILVKQYTLSKEAYEYFQLMKKNTESLGSMFDAQPSEITGNIHSVTEPGEPVVGYITASSVQEKRLFISRRELVGDWFSMWCPISDPPIPNDPAALKSAFERTSLSPFEAALSPSGVVMGYYASTTTCVDCTSRGGTNIKPSYW